MTTTNTSPAHLIATDESGLREAGEQPAPVEADAWQEGWDAVQTTIEGGEDPRVDRAHIERYALAEGHDVAEYGRGYQAALDALATDQSVGERVGDEARRIDAEWVAL